MKGFFINLMPSFMVKAFAKPYVSGNSIDKGVDKADEFYNNSKIHSTLDLLGEAVYTREGVEQTVNTYIELIDKINTKGHMTISIKPTALGIHESYEYCLTNIEKILKKAQSANIKVTLDMEDHEYTDLTLKMYKELLPKFPTFGTVLQSRLFRTEKDIEDLGNELKGLKTRIRICIGIYNESEEIALQNKSEMKEKMVEFTEKLVKQGAFVEIATHGKPYIDDVLRIAEEKGWTSENIEFQQLMGVPMKTTQQMIRDKGFTVRLYVPFATDWDYAIPYLKRRLANNPSMALYTLRHLILRK